MSDLYDDEAPDYQRGPARRRRHDWTNNPDRRLSLTVGCRHCTAPPEVPCRNTHRGRFGEVVPFAEATELEHLPAHPIRLTDAKRGPKQL